MNTKLRLGACVLPLLLSLPCPADKRRRPSPQPAEQGVVQVNTDSLGVETEPEGLIGILDEAIQKDTQSLKFRISWSSSMAEESLRGTALYNRRNKTIKTYTSFGGANFQGSSSHLYTNVTDEAIQNAVELIAKDRENPIASGNMFFDALTLFGCKHRRIK